MSEQSLGRVLPLFKENFDETTTYNKLDCVFYPVDGCSWICLRNNVRGVIPSEGDGYWQKMAQKGDQGIQGLTGTFGNPEVIVTETLPAGSSASAIVALDPESPDEAKVFQFSFGIPAGPVGYDDVAASATALSAQSAPTAVASLTTANEFLTTESYSSGTFVIYDEKIYKFIANHAAGAWDSAEVVEIKPAKSGAVEETLLDFNFGIPMADGTGVQKVDGISPTQDSQGFSNVNLSAVRFVGQSLSSSQQIIVRENINAQVAGNYLQSVSDTMNGTLSVKSANIISETPSVDLDGESISFTGASDEVIGKVNAQSLANGKRTLHMGAVRTVGTSTFNNDIGLAIDSNGNRSVILSDPDAWRTSLGIVAGSDNPAKDSGTNGVVGTSSAYARADHAHPLNVSTTVPVVDGTAAVGTSTAYARSDHKHPLNVSTTVPVVDGTAAVGTSTAYARSDHKHPLNVSTTVPVVDGTAAVGTSTAYARSDHKHPANVGTTVGAALGTAAAGTATVCARADHVHPLPAITSLSGTLAIAHGGTGATSAASARANLGVSVAPVTGTVSLGTGWSGPSASSSTSYWYQTVTISGTTAKSVIDLHPSLAATCRMVYDGTAAVFIVNNSGTLTAYAIDAKPGAALSCTYVRTETA